MTALHPDNYIPSLQGRIDNLRGVDYCTVVRLQDALNLIRHDHTNGVDVTKAMLALNRKLLSREGQPRLKRFARAKQRLSNIMSRSHSFILLAVVIVAAVVGMACEPQQTNTLSSPTPTPDPFVCGEADYGNGVYFITGNDFGVCLSRFAGSHSHIFAMSPVVRSGANGHDYVVGYFVIARAQ